VGIVFGKGVSGMNFIKRTKGDLTFDFFNVTLMTLYALMVLYPLYFITISSISDPNAVYAGEVWLWPKDVTFEGYQRIFSDSLIWIGYGNTILYAAIGTAISIVLTLTAAYPLSRPDFYGRNVIMLVFVFTMFFSGGLIPTYLLVKDLGMVNTIWAMVIPNAVGVWNIIIAKTFFETSIPSDLREAAFMDGCSNTRFFFQIVLPLSKPIIAVMVLFHVVGHWNGFFDALIYLNDETKYPLQLILRNILVENQVSNSAAMMMDVESYAAKQRVAELIKYGVIIVSTIPLLILYPFLQRYFVKGVMIGSIKG
jgi:putative aldouronate transport system permease protein